MSEQERTERPETTDPAETSTPIAEGAQAADETQAAAEAQVAEPGADALRASAAEAPSEGESAEPAAAAEPVEDPAPADVPAVAEVTEPTDATEPADVAAPAADVTEPAEVAEVTEPAEVAEVTEPAEVAEVTEPADTAPADDAEGTDVLTPPQLTGDVAPAPAPSSDAGSADAGSADAPADDETAPTSAQAPAAPTPSAVPTPATIPTPRPRPLPRPPVGAPAATPTGASDAPTTSQVPAVTGAPALSAGELAEAARWGRVDEDGTVWVRESAGERVVGQYPGADANEALAFYVRRFADLHAKVVLFESRLAATDLSVKEIDSTLNNLTEELVQPAVVGDLDGLRTRVEGLRSVAAERRAAAEAERAAAKKAALEARTAIVEAAEKIAATEPERMQWRPAGEQLRTLLDQWKDAQRHGPRVDRGAEDALWKRFSHARSSFDRERRRYFSELEKANASAKEEKTRLVAEAERLSTSTDWGSTAAAYRDLMTRWKAAGRASRKDDDALWAQFRAAQDRFFAARAADQQETDAEFAANLTVKLGLLEEAERLVPVRDLTAARSALRSIQERWEDAGKVPRGDVQRVEGRLRAVEQAVRDAEQQQWRRSNPETRARAEGAAAQLNAAIEALEADLAKAQASGDARRVAEAQAALDARRSWLEQVERAAAESRG